MTPQGNSPAARRREASVSALIQGLESEADYHAMDLARRLARCQTSRVARDNGVHAVSTSGPCRTVACPFCRRWETNRWRKRIEAQFATAGNADCSLVTIMIAKAESLESLERVIARTRIELRNTRDRHARKDRRWRRMEMLGQFEFDALGCGDVELLPPQRKDVIQSLPTEVEVDQLAGDQDYVAWVLHLHVVVHHPRLGRADIREVFGRQWPGIEGRVDVKAFYPGTAEENAGNILCYAHKHGMRTKFKDKTKFKDEVVIPWPMAVKTRFWTWLHSLRRGFSVLRVRIGAIQKERLADKLLRSVRNDLREERPNDGNSRIINNWGSAWTGPDTPRKSTTERTGQCAGRTSQDLILRI